MDHHVKKLMYTVRVGAPDPRFGTMLLEQFGGATDMTPAWAKQHGFELVENPAFDGIPNLT